MLAAECAVIAWMWESAAGWACSVQAPWRAQLASFQRTSRVSFDCAQTFSSPKPCCDLGRRPCTVSRVAWVGNVCGCACVSEHVFWSRQLRSRLTLISHLSPTTAHTQRSLDATDMQSSSATDGIIQVFPSFTLTHATSGYFGLAYVTVPQTSSSSCSQYLSEHFWPRAAVAASRNENINCSQE